MTAPRPDWPLAIAQVTPYPWGAQREVNEYRCFSEGLARRGHSVLVIAASGSRTQVRESRRLIRAATTRPGSLFAPGEVRVLAPMQTIATPARRGGRVSLPLDASDAIDTLLARAPLDIVHVHEPFAPSASAAALRHSRALNVGSFHSPTERVLSTQVARRFIELFFGRLDARLATYYVTRGLISSFFPGDYDVVPPGVDLERFAPGARERDGVHIAFVATEERAALGSSCGRCGTCRWSARGARPYGHRGRPTRRRGSRACCATGCACPGRDRRPSSRCCPARTCCARRPPVSRRRRCWCKRRSRRERCHFASRIPVYEEMLGDGDRGLLFEAGDAAVLTDQLVRLVSDSRLREELRGRCEGHRSQLGWDRVLDTVEDVYRRVIARRHPVAGKPAVRRRLENRDFIFCDLHMHTDHSPDCATPVDLLLDTAKRRGLGAIAITDHNEISGALEARQRADGIKVIVSEEVKTAHEGEVIGLFIEEKIPRGMSLSETIDAIHAQGGLAYVPHPFDRMYSVPDYEHLLKVVEDIDILEVFNARIVAAASTRRRSGSRTSTESWPAPGSTATLHRGSAP